MLTLSYEKDFVNFNDFIVATIQQHWLPIQSTIFFKVACIIYKVITTGQSSYLLQYYTPNRADAPICTANCPGVLACFSAIHLLLLIQYKLRIVQYRYGSLSGFSVICTL